MSLLLTVVGTDLLFLKVFHVVEKQSSGVFDDACKKRDQDGLPLCQDLSGWSVSLDPFVEMSSTNSMKGLTPWHSLPHKVREGICLFEYLLRKEEAHLPSEQGELIT